MVAQQSGMNEVETKTNADKISARLSVFTPGVVYPAEVQLLEGAPLFGGAGDSCQIKLAGESISQFHCMFELKDGELQVQNCETGGASILVNNLPVDGEISCQVGDTINISDCRIIVESIGTSNETEIESDAALESEDSVEATSYSIENETANEPEKLFNPDEDQWLDSENEFDSCEFEGSVEDSRDEQNHTEEELELLRSEVEYLQSELESKDQELNSFLNGAAESEVDSATETADGNETQRLVERLESLLDELQSSDERVKSLEDLLRLSEEANEAEREERVQIESWLSEIETRVAQREAELETEISRIQKQCVHAKKSQVKAEEQVKTLLADSKRSDSKNAASDLEDVQKLEQNLHQQKRLLNAATNENESLKAKIAVLENPPQSSNDVNALEEKLAQVELERSRERAELARQRAEIEQAKEQIEREQRSDSKLDDSDCRLAAMRQHLRDIHEEEKLEQLEKKQNSLSSRISRLLNRS